MNFNNQNIIDWNSPDILMKLIKNIETPLASIIEASIETQKKIKNNNISNSKDIIFSNSQEIKKIINEIVKEINGGQVEDPLIFQIYCSNERVQSMCKDKISPQRISKPDTIWLRKLEAEVYKNIKHRDVNLYDLSYNLSVSERQLHRKTKKLIYLTPNKYIRILKLHKAKQLIDNYLYDTISQVPYAVGYYDTHYFSKLFNQQYGIYPKELLSAKR